MGSDLPSIRRTRRTAVCGAAIVAGAVGMALSVPGYRPRDVVLRRVEGRIAQAPEPELLLHVRALANLGDEGIAAVVRLLASERAAEREAAQHALREQLDRWRLLPVSHSAGRALHLANVLAAQAEQNAAGDRRFEAELATHLLLWPAENARQAEALLACGERILRATGTRPERDAPEAAQPAAPATVAGPPPTPLPRRQVAAVAE